MLKKTGIMFVLSSPSGVGKTTLTKMLVKSSSNFIISVSHTTRKPRVKEKNGKDYFFVNKKSFNNLIKKDSFFEYASIFENLYGTLKKPVLENLSEGKDVLFDIDWQGTKQLKKKVTDIKLVTIFILPPSIEVLQNRLLNRDQDGKQIIEQRMQKFNQEVSHWVDYDYVVINDDLEKCYNEIKNIVDLEKKDQKHQYNREKINKLVKELI